MNDSVYRLVKKDVELMKSLLNIFGEVFNDSETYCSAQPGSKYLQRLLENQNFIVLVSLVGGDVIGGLAAYELQKFEQERSEIYIYDLAVLPKYRRNGIATALISELKKIGAKKGANVIFVQADYGDDPAIQLYTKLGIREDVLHFDIPVVDRDKTPIE